MGVFIKGYDMPDRCTECEFYDFGCLITGSDEIDFREWEDEGDDFHYTFLADPCKMRLPDCPLEEIDVRESIPNITERITNIDNEKLHLHTSDLLAFESERLNTIIDYIIGYENHTGDITKDDIEMVYVALANIAHNLDNICDVTSELLLKEVKDKGE